MKKIKELFAELLRRKVIRFVGAYIAILWLLSAGFADLFPAMGVADWVLPVFVSVGVMAIPVLAFFSWKYDLVPPQLMRAPEDVAADNPGLTWVKFRHDSRNAGFLLLRWGADGLAAKEQRFYKPVTIGREPNNDIEIPDHRVSRHHAVLFATGGGWCVHDLDSANGTFVGPARVNGTAALPVSCELRLHANGPTISVIVSKSAETRIV